MSLQLSCGVTYERDLIAVQIPSQKKHRNVFSGEINERNFSNPHAGPVMGIFARCPHGWSSKWPTTREPVIAEEPSPV